jgi:hypothetical protein
MSLNIVLVVQHHRPLDPPADFFPGLILGYSLMALWVENAMKVQQKQQQDMAQQQLDKIEELAKCLVDGQHTSLNSLVALQKMAEENEERDALIQGLISVVDHTVDTVERTTEEILRLQQKEVTE